MGEGNAEAKPRRGWYQFHLWHLFVLVLIVAIPCSWFACRMAKAKRQKEAVRMITAATGEIIYDYQFGPDGISPLDVNVPGPQWLRNLVGLDFFADVTYVAFTGGGEFSDLSVNYLAQLEDLEILALRGMEVTNTQLEDIVRTQTKLESLYLGYTHVTDHGLKYLERLPRLEDLDLTNTLVTDDGLKHLGTLAQLKSLNVDGTHVTDEGLKHLGALTNLELLFVGSTHITDDGLKHLKPLVRLEWLDLSNTGVSDAGLEQLEGMKNLRRLDFNYTPVTKEGLRHLLKLPSLAEMTLPAQITYEDEMEFWKAKGQPIESTILR